MCAVKVVQALVAACPCLSEHIFQSMLNREDQHPGASPDGPWLRLPGPVSPAPCMAQDCVIQCSLQTIRETGFRPGEEKLETAFYSQGTNLAPETHPFQPFAFSSPLKERRASFLTFLEKPRGGLMACFCEGKKKKK